MDVTVKQLRLQPCFLYRTPKGSCSVSQAAQYRPRPVLVQPSSSGVVFRLWLNKIERVVVPVGGHSTCPPPTGKLFLDGVPQFVFCGGDRTGADDSTGVSLHDSAPIPNGEHLFSPPKCN